MVNLPAFLFRYDDRVFHIVNIVIFSVLVIDIAIRSYSDVSKLTPTFAFETGLIILIAIVIVSQLLVLELVKRKNTLIIAKTSYLINLGKIVRISQYLRAPLQGLISCKNVQP